MAFDRLKQLGRNLLAPSAVEDQTAVTISAQMEALHSLKAVTLAIAGTGRTYPDDPTTMAHYATHAKAIPDLLTRDPSTFSAHEAQAHGHLMTLLGDGASIDQVWNPKIWCDLSNQKLTGILVTAEHLDLVDGGNSWRFDGAESRDCTWKPMRTHDPERAQGSTFINNVFDGMDDGERCTLGGGGTYTGTRIVNARGGTLAIDGGSTVVNGVSIEDSHLSLEVAERANIVNLTATNSHIFEIKVNGRKDGPGATLTNPVIRNTTVAMTSTLQNSVWTGSGDPARPTFENSNLSHCDFSGARLHNVCTRNTELKGWNLSGGQLTNLIIDDRLIHHADDLALYGIVTDARTRVVVTPEGKKAHQNLQVARAGDALRGAVDFAATLPTAPSLLATGTIGVVTPPPAQAVPVDPLTIARLKAAQATGRTNNLFIADEQRDLADRLRQLKDAGHKATQAALNNHTGGVGHFDAGHRLHASLDKADLIKHPPHTQTPVAGGHDVSSHDVQHALPSAAGAEHVAALQAKRAQEAAAPPRKA